MEEWRPIKDYEGLYEVSNLGRVKSLDRMIVYSNGKKVRIKERILKPSQHKGYFHVILSKDNIPKTFKIHRLVAIAFIPNPDNKPEVDHIIPISMGGTNEVNNLRWVTSLENMNNNKTKENLSKNHADFKGENSVRYGKGNPIYCIELSKEFSNMMEAERQTGISNSNISECCRGKRKTAGGYHWKYVN